MDDYETVLLASQPPAIDLTAAAEPPVLPETPCFDRSDSDARGRRRTRSITSHTFIRPQYSTRSVSPRPQKHAFIMKPVPDGPIPREDTFSSEKELTDYYYAFGKEEGFEYRPDPKGSKDCNRAGQRYRYKVVCCYTSFAKTDKNKAKKKSKRCGCPFYFYAVAAILDEPKGEWEIRHSNKPEHYRHNHKPDDIIALVTHR